MRDLARDEHNYRAERDHLPDETPCGDCGCDPAPKWRYDELSPIGDCSLTPGDPSPAGRCPVCEGLAYVLDTPDHHVRQIVAQIAAFDAKCAEAESTDTGEAWELLNSIRERLEPPAHA